MVKVGRITVQAEFLSQLRTLTLSDKAKKHIELLVAMENRLGKTENHQGVHSSNGIRFVEHSPNDFVSVGQSAGHVHNKKIRFDASFFDEVLNHMASLPSDGSFIPSRRQVLRNILHSKMHDGVYSSSNKFSGGKLSWEDLDQLLLSLVMLRRLVRSSSTVETADSDLDDLKISMDRLASKVDLHNKVRREVDQQPLVSNWNIKIEGKDASDTEWSAFDNGLKGMGIQVESRQVRAFSSAPIWYQQGMENGPPPMNVSVGVEKLPRD